MKSCEVWFNSACSTCNKTKAILEELSLSIQYVHYLDNAPSKARILEVLTMLGDPSTLIRTKEASYGESGLSTHSSMERIADALSKDPRLIQRPVVIVEGVAIVARPPESVRTHFC